MRIAVTGLSRGENPQPGAAIVAGIRAAHPGAFIIGMAYDATESGIYAKNGPDAVYTIPFPSEGAEAFLKRIDEVRARTPFEVLIPTLDSEMELMVDLAEELQARGIRTSLPDKATYLRRTREQLSELASVAGVSTPRTHAVYTVSRALLLGREMRYPILVKGAHHDTHLVENEAELAGAVSLLFAQWGAPVLLQEVISGTEHHAMGIGDGEGGLFGLCAIRRPSMHGLGKNVGGITVRDDSLREVCERLVRELRWRGPFEVVTIMDETVHRHFLIKMAPRFPSWVGFPTGFGANFPAALARFIVKGVAPDPVPEPIPGWFYLQHQVEVFGQTNQLDALSGGGSWMGEDGARYQRA
ncbi:carbamoyl-phosphate synthase large subunit [Roseimicrobium gellanilyticum]|uniref:Carbamoyl-phosphate synthase large subunit n=1 Tax=Roseimicrobium gellanilyticum TaxID=748857 RepID=A0A366HIS6_9BACT|nr:hypothetical protein [Roseimicrobium gellanilyticum]RBP42667.1 carbamoyl-phosphate synthase large subunit [Roseimicrobium gellanilyticum]